MKKLVPAFKLLLLVGVIGAIALATDVYAKKPGGGGCPRNIACPDVWDPVICSDGRIYSNDCYAYRDCATGCVPYGDDSMMSLEVKPGSGGCPRRINCLDVWDPVICSNGQVYSNDCYAYRACATGCVPYGDDTIITESEQCSQ